MQFICLFKEEKYNKPKENIAHSNKNLKSLPSFYFPINLASKQSGFWEKILLSGFEIWIIAKTSKRCSFQLIGSKGVI